MLFFRRRQPIVSNIAPFGTLTFAPKLQCWCGEYRFPPTGCQVSIELPGGPLGPDNYTLQLISNLASQYHTLSSPIANALFQTWDPQATTFEMPTPLAPPEMLRLLALQAITVTSRNELELTYAFAEEGVWDDASFGVILRDWAVREVHISD